MEPLAKYMQMMPVLKTLISPDELELKHEDTMGFLDEVYEHYLKLMSIIKELPEHRWEQYRKMGELLPEGIWEVEERAKAEKQIQAAWRARKRTG
jgi:hypothetical protein